MKKLKIIALLLVLLMTGCARVNQLWFTKDGYKTKTRGGVDMEIEWRPDGTRIARFSSKKGKPMWEKIANIVSPDKFEFGTGK